MRWTWIFAALVACDTKGGTVDGQLSTTVTCPVSGNGRVDFDPADPCVFAICRSNISRSSWPDVLSAFELELGPASCAVEDPVSGWRQCTFVGDDSVRILFDTETGEPDADSSVFDVDYVLRSPDVQSPLGLAPGVPLACFEQHLGRGPLWFWDYDGGYLSWFADRLEGSIAWSE